MWVVFALLTSFFNAAYFLLNQKMAMKASLFMVYRGWAVFFMLLPFAGLFTPVPHWEFYALHTCILIIHNSSPYVRLLYFYSLIFLLRCQICLISNFI